MASSTNMEEMLLCSSSNDTELCSRSTMSTAYVWFNAVSILLNVINLCVLSTVNKSKKTPYYWIIINIGISDIAASLSYILMINCSLNYVIVNLPLAHARGLQIVFFTFGLTTATVRNSVLALGSYERYASICHALEIDSNKIINNLGLCILAIWIGCLGLMAASVTTNTAGYCFGEFGSLPPSPNIQTTVVFGVSISVTSFICTICLYKVLKELNKMQNRHTVTKDDGTIKRSAQYILLICLLFYISYVPTFVAVILDVVGSISSAVISATRWAAIIVQSLYGALNSLLYVYMTPGYRLHIKNLFTKSQTLAKVTPDKRSAATA